MTDQFITAEQFRGGSFDGQYSHLGVPKLFDAHYDTTGHYAGTEDLRLMKEKASPWIVQMTKNIGRAFKVVN